MNDNQLSLFQQRADLNELLRAAHNAYWHGNRNEAQRLYDQWRCAMNLSRGERKRASGPFTKAP